MSDVHSNARGSRRNARSDAPGDSGAERSGWSAAAHDLDALRTLTLRDQPSVHEVAAAARRRSTHEPQEGWSTFMRVFMSRPALATALTVVVLAVGLLVVPISYQRTTGYEVSLFLVGAGIEPTQLMEIARSYKETLGSQGVTVDAQMDDGEPRYVLKASAATDMRHAADAFAGQLSQLGYAASAEVRPIEETVSTNVMAYAYGRMIEISVDGKSAAELESEIRSRLAAAGVTAQVSVTNPDDKHQEVKINAEREALGNEGPEPMPELVLTKDGKPMTGGFGVNVMKKKVAESGTTSLIVRVDDQGRVVQAEVPNADTMSDAAIAAAIEAQLAAAGLSAVVRVQGNDISVERRKP